MNIAQNNKQDNISYFAISQVVNYIRTYNREGLLNTTVPVKMVHY